MSRGVQWSLFGSAVVAALIALAGCSHYLFAEREPWRRDAEVACLNSGAVKEGPERVRISAISGPGVCGADFPLRVSALGDSAPLGYDDEPVRPPSAIPNGALPQRWPVIQSNALPPLPSGPPQYGAAPSAPPPYDAAPSASPHTRATARFDANYSGPSLSLADGSAAGLTGRSAAGLPTGRSAAVALRPGRSHA